MKNLWKFSFLVIALLFTYSMAQAQQTTNYKPSKGDTYVYVFVRYNQDGKCPSGFSNRRDDAKLVLNWGAAYRNKTFKLKSKRLTSINSQGAVLRFKNYGNDWPLTVTSYGACEVVVDDKDPGKGKTSNYEYKNY